MVTDIYKQKEKKKPNKQQGKKQKQNKNKTNTSSPLQIPKSFQGGCCGTSKHFLSIFGIYIYIVKNVQRGIYWAPFVVSVKNLIMSQIKFISEKGITIFFENH